MPFYEYRCDSCGHEESSLESINAPQQKACPECGKKRAFKRLVSAAGFQLKGEGWYVTDFRDNDKKKKEAAKADKGKDDKAKKVDGDGKKAEGEKKGSGKDGKDGKEKAGKKG